MFQSAGRIIGWLKPKSPPKPPPTLPVSIRRADYWLVEASWAGRLTLSRCVSIRRADYWLVEDRQWHADGHHRHGFNPPGGLLVG